MNMAKTNVKCIEKEGTADNGIDISCVCAQCQRRSLSRYTKRSVRMHLGTTSNTLLIAVVLLGLVMESVAKPSFIDCARICDRGSAYEEPQNCKLHCKEYIDYLRIKQQEITQTDDFATQSDLQRTVDYLLALTGITLALVAVVLILMVLMFVRISRASATKFTLASFFSSQRKKENVDRMIYHKGKSPGTRKKNVSSNGLISTISTSTKEESSVSQPTENLSHHSPPFGLTSVRTRQPSESTCPEEPTEGYDNLGLSTTTLTLPSSDTFGPAVSTVTLDTTLNDNEPQQLSVVGTTNSTRSH
ncbi:uncharacterized protein LOC143020270 isoform X1 [Oratosquilla oratoria]|uniref:uncharacterized protein LOC143020270 isoform X1 n=1 Tax=Oratosquilla oratoria TaxID=337810 RepID=UPI003F763B41